MPDAELIQWLADTLPRLDDMLVERELTYCRLERAVGGPQFTDAALQHLSRRMRRL